MPPWAAAPAYPTPFALLLIVPEGEGKTGSVVPPPTLGKFPVDRSHSGGYRLEEYPHDESAPIPPPSPVPPPPAFPSDVDEMLMVSVPSGRLPNLAWEAAVVPPPRGPSSAEKFPPPGKWMPQN